MARAIKRTHVTHCIWAIETGKLRPRYLPRVDSRPQSLASYTTRRAAREALAAIKLIGMGMPKARVVRVSVTVTTIGRG